MYVIPNDTGRLLTSHTKQRVYKWYANRPDPEAVVPRKKKDTLRLVKAYTVREVAAKMNPSRVEEIQTELATEYNVDGRKRPIGLYQKAVKQLQEELTVDEIREYQKLAELWNTEGPPPEEQRKNFKKLGTDMAKEFATTAFKRAGMRVFILAAAEMENGQLGVTQ